MVVRSTFDVLVEQHINALANLIKIIPETFGIRVKQAPEFGGMRPGKARFSSQ
jgi:hypothetical protein